MSKFQNKSEIDINTVDPDLLKLAKQLASKMKTGKETDKSICKAAVKIPTKNRINDKIQKGDVVYRMKDSNDKEGYFSHCILSCVDGEDYCFKHNKNPDNFLVFEDIVSNNDSYKMGKGDLLKVRKTSNKKTTTDKNPNPIITVSLSNKLRKQILSLANLDNETDSISEVEEEEKSVVEESEKEDDASTEEIEKEVVKDDSENNSENDSENDSDDDSGDEASTISILTKDGRELYLDQDDNTVYELDDDNEGVDIGKLIPVNDSTAPIFMDEMSSNCIVGKELVDKGKDYIRCTVSNKLYQKKSKKMNCIGHVNIAKNGSLKVVLDKKGKKK